MEDVVEGETGLDAGSDDQDIDAEDGGEDDQQDDGLARSADDNKVLPALKARCVGAADRVGRLSTTCVQ